MPHAVTQRFLYKGHLRNFVVHIEDEADEERLASAVSEIGETGVLLGNSARTFWDSCRFDFGINNICLILIDTPTLFYEVPFEWIYCNTVDDILLSSNHDLPTGPPVKRLSLSDVAHVLNNVDLVVPMLHGAYGEDGRFARALEAVGCSPRFIGSAPDRLCLLFDKVATYRTLTELGFLTPAFIEVPKDQSWQRSALLHPIANTSGRLVVKPRRGGSSDGVSVVDFRHLDSAIHRANAFDVDVLIEEFIEGREFSVIVIEDADFYPVSFLPTEVIVDDSVNPYIPDSKSICPAAVRFFVRQPTLRTA